MKQKAEAKKYKIPDNLEDRKSKAAKYYDNEARKSKIEISSLKDSKLPKMKIDSLTYNLEKYTYVNANEEIEKLLSKVALNENYDLDSILPLLFISLKINELNRSKINTLNNYSQNMDIIHFFSLYGESPNFLRNEDIEFALDKYKNFKEENITYSDINSFHDIYEKDNFFTFVTQKESLKTVLLLAELFTEQSKQYSEVFLNNVGNLLLD
jgi:hypothetical protein